MRANAVMQRAKERERSLLITSNVKESSPSYAVRR